MYPRGVSHAPEQDAATQSSPATSVEAVAARERMLRIAWLCAAAWAFFAVSSFILGRPRVALINTFAALSCLAAVQVLRGAHSRERTRLSVHIGLGSATIALIAAAQVAGQGASMPLWYLPLVPFVGGLLGDHRVALGWTAIGVTGILGTHALETVLPLTPEFEVDAFERLFSQLTLVLMALGAAIATRRGTDAALAKVREREAIIRAQSVELSSARDVAEAASRAKSEFLATMTHELRTPLNGLIGPVEVLARSELSTTQRETLGIVESSARVLRGLVDSILDFSKIEAGRMELRPARTRVRRAVHETLRVFEAMASARGVALRVSFDDGVPEALLLDTTRFQQTLMNLVGNAVKFTRDGRVDVRVRYADAHGALQVTVEDTGIGIDPAALPHIFDAFQQGDSSSTREFGGTGLGLAICAHLVQLAGGRIDVTSEVGRGTRFEFSWPAPRVDDGTHSVSGPDLLAAPGLRVLVAEDEPVNQKVITMMLSQLGVTPTLVDTGLAAVEAAARYDVIFMDMRLPGLNGLDATLAIRETIGTERPWIIAATANATEHDRARCLAAGMNDFVAKPLQLAHLAAALARAEAELGATEASPERPTA